MSGVSTAVSTLCCSLIVATLVRIIAPQGNTEKIIKLIISAFILVSIVLAVKSVVDLVDTDKIISDSESIVSYENTEMNNEKVLKTASEYLVEYSKNLLESNNISVDNIKITLVESENSVIYVREAIIYINRDYLNDEDRIINLISSNLGVSPKIVFGSNNE